MLEAPRRTYGTEFSNVFSSDRIAQHSYVDGLLIVGLFFVVIFVVWTLVLIVLKLKGKEVGCASGSAFHTERSDDED